MELGQLVIELAVQLLIAIARLARFSGRMLYAAAGLTPAREIMLLTGIGLWALLGAFAFRAWLR